MKVIPITCGKFVFVDDADFDYLSKFSWQCKKNGKNFYAQRSTWIPREKRVKVEKMHRVILGVGKIDSRHIDHINGDGLDNRRCNLRFVTHQENHFNSRKRDGCISVFKGVRWNKQKNKWYSEIWLNGKRDYLGCFVNEIDAAMAYDDAAKNRFGAFARTNEMMGISR